MRRLCGPSRQFLTAKEIAALFNSGGTKGDLYINCISLVKGVQKKRKV